MYNNVTIKGRKNIPQLNKKHKELYTKTDYKLKNDDRATLLVLNTKLRFSQKTQYALPKKNKPTLKETTQTQSRIVTISTFRIKYTRIALRKILKITHNKSSKGN